MLLGWIPIIGPIIDGITSVVKSFNDTSLGKYQVDGQVDIQAMKASNELTLAFIADISVRFARDLVMFPGSVWCMLYIWDKIVDHHYPGLVFNVASLDGPMVYLPYALMGFFFGSAWINRTR